MSEKTKCSIFDSLYLDELTSRGVSFTTRDKSGLSKAFVIPNKKDIKGFLMGAFGIDENSGFSKKYRQAITGSGGAEKDFDALKSSALCALLCFYPIKNLRIDDVTYHNVYFEVKNRVIDTPSNMDVVLVGEDDARKRVILFLECKFSEYLENTVQHVSAKYFEGNGRDYYDSVKAAGLGKFCTVDDKDYHFFTPRAYSQGTKQVISHLLGLHSFLGRNKDYAYEVYPKSKGDEDRRELYENEYDRVIFRELLFDFKEEEFGEKLSAYIELSKDVRSAFKDLIPAGLEFADPITYQDLFSVQCNVEQLNPIVARFYGFLEPLK